MSGYIEVADKKTGDSLIKVYQSKLYTFLSTIDTAGMKGVNDYSLPFLDLTQDWTDEQIYAHFKLTGDEIAYIKAAT
jgi:hypothetical protein